MPVLLDALPNRLDLALPLRPQEVAEPPLKLEDVLTVQDRSRALGDLGPLLPVGLSLKMFGFGGKV